MAEVLGAVLEVGVQDGGELLDSVLESSSERLPFRGFAREDDLTFSGQSSLREFAGPVGRAVVDDDELAGGDRELGRQRVVDGGLDSGELVETGMRIESPPDMTFSSTGRADVLRLGRWNQAAE